MGNQLHIQANAVVFNRWSRKQFAIFASLGKNVLIGHLSFSICQKAIKAVKVFSCLAYELISSLADKVLSCFDEQISFLVDELISSLADKVLSYFDEQISFFTAELNSSTTHQLTSSLAYQLTSLTPYQLIYTSRNGNVRFGIFCFLSEINHQYGNIRNK